MAVVQPDGGSCIQNTKDTECLTSPKQMAMIGFRSRVLGWSGAEAI